MGEQAQEGAPNAAALCGAGLPESRAGSGGCLRAGRVPGAAGCGAFLSACSTAACPASGTVQARAAFSGRDTPHRQRAVCMGSGESFRPEACFLLRGKRLRAFRKGACCARLCRYPVVPPSGARPLFCRKAAAAGEPARRKTLRRAGDRISFSSGCASRTTVPGSGGSCARCPGYRRWRPHGCGRRWSLQAWWCRGGCPRAKGRFRPVG